jgi:predicted outer membrane repeat protein
MGSRAARPLLLALLLALQGRGARALSYWSTVPASGAVVISDSYVVDSALAVAPGATLTIEGDLAACAGPCYVNALGASQIATVGAGASLTLKYLVLLNGTSALPGGALAGAAGSSITLVGAYVGVSKSAGAGGCIYTAGALSLYATTLQYCQSAVDGGGAWVGGALYIGAASTVSSNLAYGSGGGVVAAGGLTVDSSAFDGNYAGLLGGGIYNLLLPMTVSGSTIDNSFTVGGGGAVYSNGDAAFADSNFTNNDGGAGGGVLLLNAPATAFSAERCVFTSNYASDVGGALFLRPLFSCNDTACSQLGNLTLADCLFELNFVTLGGAAAVYVYDPAALVVARCAFNRNKGKDLGAGAIYARGGTADISLSSFTGNLGASSVNSQGGAVTLLGDFPCSARVADCTFDGNIVFAPDVSRALLGNDIVHAPMDLEVGQGAGGGMLVKNNFATSTMAVTIERCTFTGNQASAGGGAIAAMKRAGCAMDLTVLDSVFSGNQAGHGAAVESFINATFSNCSFAGNSATNGGAINLVDVGTTSFVGGSVTGNAASFAGAAFQVGGTHSLTLSGALIADNVALAGAFIALASPTQSVALAGLTVRNNSAYAGALYYASAPLAAPTCSGCTMAANSAASYGPVIASLPASFNTTSSSFAARSGEPLQPAITVQVFDAFGQAVLNWPDLLITVAAAPPENGLSGGAAVYYANGAATLNQLSIVDQVGSNYTLVYKLTCPELLLLNSSVAGATAALDATVEPCFPLERYDARSQRCFCAPGAALLNGDCACTYGTYATPGGGDAEGQESCVPCPEGAVCLGPYPPLAMEDWWHEPGNREVFYSCHRRACMAEQPATYASSYDNCQAGHEGPLCGMCSKGYTFRGDYCLPCETGEAYAEWSSTKRGGMAFGAAFAFFVGSVTIMLYPLFPEVNARLTGMVDQRVGANAMTRVVRLLSRLAPHIVVAISSLQIVSSFSRTTEVAWCARRAAAARAACIAGA